FCASPQSLPILGWDGRPHRLRPRQGHGGGAAPAGRLVPASAPGPPAPLSGRTGAGKTTLLRMLAGETSVDGGELNLAKDVRVALHDQRPPRERALSLRDYVLGGCKDLLALEERLAELEHAMAEGDTSPGTLEAYATAQARLEHA